MARPTSSSARDLRAAALADAAASELAHAAQALTGNHETVEALRAMARHNRILALKLRTMQGLASDRMGLARTS